MPEKKKRRGTLEDRIFEKQLFRASN